MKRLIFSCLVIGLMLFSLSSCDKKNANLLIGTWNWVNPYPANYDASHGVMSYTFTNKRFEVKYDHVCEYYNTHAYVKGTYTYDEDSRTLVMTPLERVWEGTEWTTVRTYLVQSIDESSMVLIMLRNGTTYSFTK